MPKRCCSSESQIKAIFFIHFTLFFFFLALNFTGEGRSQLMYLFSGTFLLVALFAALCSKSRAHHLAHLAGLIDLAAVLLDVLLFWPQLTSPEYLIKPYWTPFFLNLLLRLPFAFILLRITASVGNSEENGCKKSCTAAGPVQLKNKKSLLSEDDIESPNSGGDKNNNSSSFNNRFSSYSTDDGANEPARRLLLSNKSTEV